MKTLVGIKGLKPFTTNDDWQTICGQIIMAGHNPVMTQVHRANGDLERQITTNLITNAGRDFIATQLSGAASASAVAKWIALSSDGTAPAAGDTTIASEITGNGLGRAEATYAHTNGTATFTLQRQWSVSGTQNNIQKMGVFNAVSTGTLVFATMLAESKSVSNGDTLTVTWTGTIGS
jgi:hypothetical protein